MNPRKYDSDPCSGNAFIEFAMVFVLLTMFIVGAFEFSWALFLRATFHHAVREGVRYALTGTVNGSGLDQEIKEVIGNNSFGILDQAALDEHVSVEFFDPTCPGFACGAGGAADPKIAPAEAGSIIRVGINCYDIVPVTALISKDDTGARKPLTLTVTASDKMEPFPGGPPSRGALANPTACD